jgi:DNA methylase
VHFESGSGRAGNPPDGKHGAEWEQAQSGDYDIRMGPVTESQTIGWQPSCLCRGQHGRTVPQLVLDPFGGSGTTGRVAIELGRRPVLLDLAYNAEYAALAKERTSRVQIAMALR